MGKSFRMSYIAEFMEPEIWGKFPEDLFEFVLARLPIAIIFRFRIVCRQWNNLLTTQRFYQHFDQVSQENPWFCTTYGNNKYGAIYDPFMKRWHCSTVTEEVPVLPVSSAGGLVCFCDKSYQDLYVCNPLNQSFKKLPTGSIKICFHLGMSTNGSAGYKVLRLGCNRDYEIYDSIIKFWGHLGQIPASIELLGFSNFNPIAIGNTLYFMNTVHEGIVSCDTSTGVWAHHLIPAPLLSSDLKLVQCDAWIMLVGMVKENDVAYVCIWELEKMTFLFKEVDRMPCLEFHRGSVYLTCLGDKGLIMLYLKSCYNDMHLMFTYNIATREWLKVPVPYGIKLHKKKLCRTAFQPSLTAMP